jgi:hypothetical protein
MSRIEKLKARLKLKPKDFSYAELVTLLNSFGYTEWRRGKTGGSRRAFIHSSTKHVIHLHKPHPGNELKIYQILEIIDELTQSGYL